MFWASYALAALAIILAWPVPILLSRAKWPARSPFTAMVLWQAIALAGGLSMIGAMLTWGLEPLGNNLLDGLQGLWAILVAGAPASELGLVHVFALSAASLLSAHLVFTLLLTWYRILRGRRRHRDMLNLLSSPSSDAPATLVIQHPTPVAYCLPGGARSVTVLSDGLLNMLSEDELSAVLTHERAHLAQHHHLLLWAFAAWRAALPWLPTSLMAQRSVNELIEMLADDEALRKVDRLTLVRSVAIVGSGSPAPGRETPAAPASNSPAALGGPDFQEPLGTAGRLSRLLTPQPPLPRWQQVCVLCLSVLLLAVPTTLLIAPGLLD
ncbi:M56 family metallopeptidase [Arthrobacter sp. zg-Y40]|uniref:M56 family metallopeptidase n=1 Tax=unclassified Arthrobacter TaxID=235627 RepID=UPI001D141910|nr:MULTISPECIES: M56 family metallopeptidase [unclassified Arthrobacter]MCC3279616.1 M56 family metallopeptidase [Arthrobacter sp. zg-Y40]MCC3274389.1 M56 family metallopeptidase [Arthrobacter sp. zg-Y20]MDK1314545.1 M56 family metallopeptidase [Arthrobacter sp. zg.Y20]MDK1327433.1 M56 family metallopeptidase [Arthrobacter sp. zg-Y1143]WIB07528.1 M56 family metallopeptidase [Arthrobacter sp. zg-Y20]